MEQQSPFSAGAIVALVILYAAIIGVFVWMYVRIIRKAGYSGWWALMGLVPIANVVMVGLFAFREWPIRRELAYLRGYAAATGLPGYAPVPQYPYGQPPPAPGHGGQLPPGSQPWSDQPPRWDRPAADRPDGDQPPH